MRALGLFAVVCSVVACRMGFQPAEPPPLPNIVVFLVDDMGWQDTSVAFDSERTPFNEFFRTPAMVQLAKDGVSFTQAYSCAVCTPSRVSLLTGQNASRHHVTNWTLNGETGGQSEQLGPPAWKREGLQPGDAPTLPEQIGRAHV